MSARSQMAIKVYLVVQRQNLSPEGEPNRKIVAAKLTRTAAQEVVDQVPGTYIEKHFAVK